MEHQENAPSTVGEGQAAPIPAQSGPSDARPPVSAVTTCYRHADRECYVRCTRCDQFICPDCMRAASVGFHCPDCVKEGVKSQRQARTVFGGRIAGARPTATITLILLNVLAFAGELRDNTLIDRFSEMGRGMMGSDGRAYTWTGTVPDGFHAAGVAHGEWYRLLTSAFLHMLPSQGLLGITHILFNMMWLWRLGPVMEAQLGRARYVALYLVAAVGGSTVAYVLAPDSLAIGASGAIFGLVGGYWVMSRRLRNDPLGGNGLLVMFVIWMVVSAGFDSWQGHLGGLLAGLAVGTGFAFAPRGKARPWVQAGAVVLVCAALVALVLWETSRIGAI
ncbi:rhomboid family intramembrane serine protease [Streptacidiphilus neutrinimicus]|uniref:rhomboid family intramembrane serine protease n=1 Tax=Streptacidiphilus neutrinimicus TaxID=105420 RepID=UPI000A0387D5|nr:rhomboid family intramembrane serine protease [Streptacidiphilus neutrinimicus]